MTFAPSPLKKAQAYLHDVTGLGWASLGIVGDSAHRGGYHCGSDRVDADDYSVDESARDRQGLSGAASALDIGSFNRLREFSKWLVAECKAGAEDTKDIREVIYSPDGQTVRRWDRLGIRSSGDSSHRFHTHISFFRDSEDRDKTAVFRRFFEGAPRPSVPSAPAKPSTPTTDWTQELIMSLPTIKDNSAPVGAKKLAQAALAAKGFPPANTFDSRGRPDGKWGNGSKSATKSFQAANGLTQDGIPGPKTWSKLIKA
jgi:hypothetical protein